MYWIVRMMSVPKIGLAPMDWQYGGMNGPAPPVVVARTDGVPFTKTDWCRLDEFETHMLDNGPRKITRDDLLDYFCAYKLTDKDLGAVVREALEEIQRSGKPRTGGVAWYPEESDENDA